MMRKMLLLLAVAVGCLAVANAQLIERNPVAGPLVPQTSKAPVMRALGENQMYLGPYTSDALAVSGLGLSNYSGVFQMGTILPLDMVEPFNGGEVKAIRFGLCSTITNGAVLLFTLNSINPLVIGDTLVWQNVGSTVVGWNQVELETPVTINTKGIAGLLLGYQYKQIKGSTNASYPISVVDEGEILTSLTNAGSLTENQWEDIGLSEYGNLSVQAIVENENFPTYNLNVSKLSCPDFVNSTEGIDYTINLSNIGIKTLNNYKIEVMLDGEVVSQIESPMPLTQNISNYDGHLDVEGLSSDFHTFAVRAVEQEGESIERPILEAQFFAYSTSFPRQKHLVEQFTAQGCTYCPLGVNVLSALSTLRKGDLAWVAIHNNFNGTDVYTISKGTQMMNYLGGDSYPSAAFNRYNGDEGLVISLGYIASYTQMAAEMINETYIEGDPTPALVSLKLSGKLDKDNNKLSFKVSGESAVDLTNYVGLSVYLTEDSLVARQLNQGTWVQKYIHNHVLRAMPTALKGDAINLTDDLKFENEYTVTLNSAWNTDKMHLVAFVNINNGFGTAKNVLNCEMSALNDLTEESSGIVGDVNNDGKVDVDDINIIVNIILGTDNADNYDGRANIDGQGNVDVQDINMLLNIMLGLN